MGGRFAALSPPSLPVRELGWDEGHDQSYIEDLKKRKGAAADPPHRIAFKKLVRA